MIRPGGLLMIGWLVSITACSMPSGSASGIRLEEYEPATRARLRAAGWRTELSDADPEGLSRIAIGPIGRGTARASAVAAAVRADGADLGIHDPVVVVRTEAGVRGWPIAPLREREILADEVDGVPVLVAFCSLCATVRVWDRRLGGEVLDLRVSGLLHRGNSLLYDRETESLWEQRSGCAIVGARAGQQLRALPSFVISFGALCEDRPDAAVAEPRDPVSAPPWRTLRAEDLATGRAPSWFRADCEDPLGMLLTWEDEGEALTEPLAGDRVEHRGGSVVFRDPDCAAPYRFPDGALGPRTGSAAVFRRWVRGRRLTFAPDGTGFRDRETGTLWNRLGEAVDGSLRGERLDVVDSVPGFRASLPGAE